MLCVYIVNFHPHESFPNFSGQKCGVIFRESGFRRSGFKSEKRGPTLKSVTVRRDNARTRLNLITRRGFMAPVIVTARNPVVPLRIVFGNEARSKGRGGGRGEAKGERSRQPDYNKVEIYKRERNINGDYIELWLTLYTVDSDGRNVVIDIPGKKKPLSGWPGRHYRLLYAQTVSLFNIRNDRRLIIRLIYTLMKKLFEKEKRAAPDVLMLVIRSLF